MEETYGCNLINTKHDGRQVKEFVGKYHVHVLVRQGQMTFSDGKNSFTSRQGDLAIWQMSNTIQRVECSDDFEADVLSSIPRWCGPRKGLCSSVSIRRSISMKRLCG